MVRYMQTGAVPSWVTLALAVIALVGPLGGAWIGARVTARRDDRRWDRDRERDDIRWRRESAERTANREYEAENQWRDRRSNLYADLLGTTDKLDDLLAPRDSKGLYRYASYAELEVVSTPLLELLNDQLRVVTLVGSDQMSRTARYVIQIFESQVRHFEYLIQTGLYDDIHEGLTMTPREGRRELHRRMREDLGIDPPTPADDLMR